MLDFKSRLLNVPEIGVNYVDLSGEMPGEEKMLISANEIMISQKLWNILDERRGLKLHWCWGNM